MMRNRSFPRWSGPLVGGMMGAYVGLRVKLEHPDLGHEQGSLFSVWIGAGVGIAAGCLIFLLEPGASSARRVLGSGPVPAAGPGSVVGRVSAVLSASLFCVPFVGIILGIIAIRLNRHERGWRIVSWVGTGLSLLINLLYLFLTVFLKKPAS